MYDIIKINIMLHLIDTHIKEIKFELKYYQKLLLRINTINN